MHIHHLLEQNSIANKFIAQLRDVNIQSDRLRFRRNIERLGEVLGYELSKNFTYESKDITTPLGTSAVELPKE